MATIRIDDQTVIALLIPIRVRIDGHTFQDGEISLTVETAQARAGNIVAWFNEETERYYPFTVGKKITSTGGDLTYSDNALGGVKL